MSRRDFVQGLSAASLLSFMDPTYFSAKELLQSGKAPVGEVPQRRYGRAEEMISMIGFGGIVVKDVTPNDASNYVSEAIDRGINYFDVAPTYGNAQERLGPSLKPYRDKCFLACKTTKRDAKGAAEELAESFRLLQTDHFDLYQLHAITTLEEVEQVFAKDGAMETFLKAKEQGKVRYLGFSAHSEEAAHLPSHALIPPGHWDLFKMAVELAQSDALTPLNDNEREIVRAIAMDAEPIFAGQA